VKQLIARPQAARRRALGLLVVLVLSGCSTGIYPVEGKVVWKDGTPATELKGAHVVFNHPEKSIGARGYVQEDGSFRLTTNRPNDGALAGEYRVLIVEIARKTLGGPDASAIAPGAMDSRFSDPSTTDLRATVKPGTNRVTLTVERSRPAKVPGKSS
jgi:hypothetical protein